MHAPRLLKKAHLRGRRRRGRPTAEPTLQRLDNRRPWPHAQRTGSTPRVRPAGAASHLDLFDGGPRHGPPYPPVRLTSHGRLGKSAVYPRCSQHLRWTAPCRGCRGAHPVGSRAASASTGVTRHHGRAGDIGRERSMMADDYDLYVGIDLATEAHQVCLLDATAGLLDEQPVAHTGSALAALADALTRRVPDVSRIAVAIEIPRGAVVDTLLERGLHVFVLNPKQLDRFRDRFTVAGAKDDRRDARVAADALRTDRAAFRRVHAEDPRLIQLREVSRMHEELAQEHVRLSNRLRDRLLRLYPQALEWCPAADEAWLWTLLDQAPTPAAARRLSPAALRALLRTHRIRRFTADALHTALQAA